MNDRLAAVIDAARRRHLATVRADGIIALLLGALLWFTQWPSLRIGLTILLIGYLCAVLLLLNRNRQLTRDIENPTHSWFDAEARFSSRLNILEGLTRTIGFVVLGYGFWRATGSIALALALGIGYPVAAYFGMERRKYLRTRQLLKSERDALFNNASS